jgi:hypothetical protein
MVGNKDVKNVKEMVAELLRVDAITQPVDPNEGHGNIRIVYWYRNHDGTMTQRLSLTATDVQELKDIDRKLTADR